MFSKQVAIIGGAAAAVLASVYVFWGPGERRKPKRKDYCRGLENLGNTCFLNAVLQSWGACPTVLCWLHNFLSRNSEAGSVRDLLAASILKVLNVVNDNTLDGSDPCSPGEVITALRLRRWVISPEEQDAHELFQVLTETLDEETSQYPRVVSLFDVQAIQNPCNKYQPQGLAMTRSRGLLPVLPHQKMEHPFRGLLASQLQCRDCGHRCPVKYDLFNSLSLSIPANFWGPLSLDMLLHHYICPEMVKDVQCPGCAKLAGTKDPSMSPKSCFKKKLTIGKVPQCLCIHIQRTQWLNNSLPVKRYDFISFPEVLHMDSYVYMKGNRKDSDNKNGLFGGKDATLDLLRFGSNNGRFVSQSAPVNLLRALNYDSHTTKNGLFLQPPCPLSLPNTHGDVNHNGPDLPKQTEFTYRLSSVVAHLGDEVSGHFVTYRRSPLSGQAGKSSDKWLYTSDANVQRASREQVLGSEAYMLFYERI
ncbi:ubiquitin carboxyl-terminal hydrolase 30-like [Haliotis cracherodii]|uniref:ubiquitin carboxyl-terminal hydrolase 30-like n=1 Tax=Haliotis cracherodii TaxID=6455 RepID=UPI0039E787B9